MLDKIAQFMDSFAGKVLCLFLLLWTVIGSDLYIRSQGGESASRDTYMMIIGAIITFITRAVRAR